ncbi:MAG: amidohydrolase [Leucobacter sp.]
MSTIGAAAAGASARGPADLVIRNAAIYTGVDAGHGSTPPLGGARAEALAARDGRIVAVGAEADVAALIGPETRIVDLGGAFVMPGLVDAHDHYHLEGQGRLHEVSVPETATVGEIVAAVAAETARRAPGEWIVVASYGMQLIGELSRGDALRLLDAVSPEHPVMVREVTRHNRWVNSVALQAAGVDSGTADPAHGEIVRDPATGEPTGLLVEGAGIAVEHLYAAARPFAEEDFADRVRYGVARLNEFGVTALQDAGSSEQAIRGAALLDGRGELNAWVVSSLTLHEQIFGFQPSGEELLPRAGEFATAHHRASFVKIFLDGIPPTHTGSFIDPYADGVTVGPLLDRDALVDALRLAAQHGLSAKMHCTGDGSVRAALDAVERIREEGFADTIYHIAHAQFISEADVPRFAQLGAVVEISPYMWFPGPIEEMIDGLVREGLARRMHPNRELLDAGALVAVGSDWPAGPDANPWHAVHGLVNRSDPEGLVPGVAAPDQAVTLAEALRMVTIDGARALGIAADTGSLEPGKSADFAVLDRDPFAIDPAELHAVRATATWFAGREVFSG